MYLGVTYFTGVFGVDSGPFQRLGIKQHRMSSAGLHNQDLVRTDFVQIRLAYIFLRFIPTRSDIIGTVRILGDEVLDNLAVFGVIGQSDVAQVGLPHKTVTGKIRVAVGFQEARIDEIVAIVQHFGIGAGDFFRFLYAAYV